MREFISNTRPRNLNMKKEKESVQNSALALLKGRKMVFNAFRSGNIFNAFKKQKNLKIFTKMNHSLKNHFYHDFMKKR